MFLNHRKIEEKKTGFTKFLVEIWDYKEVEGSNTSFEIFIVL